MAKRIPAMTARENFGELLEEVFYKGDEVVVERTEKPMEAQANLGYLWATIPAVEDKEAAERGILEEVEVARHGQYFYEIVSGSSVRIR